MKHVIVFGKNGYNTLGLIRCLGEQGIPFVLVLLASQKINYTLLSKYVRKYKKVASIEVGIEYITHIFKDNKQKAVIIPTNDRIASELDRNYDRLNKFFIFPNAGKQGVLTALMDKKTMTDLALQSGLSVPITIEYEYGKPIPEDIVFPCIIKPKKSIDGTKKDIRKCDNVSDLKRFLASKTQTHIFLIQQYIKKEFDILLIGCRCLNGEVICPAIFKKERWFSEGEDGSYGVITSDTDSYIDMNTVRTFLKALKYVGPFSIEYGVEKGIPYFFEINLRNDGTSHYFVSSQINIPYAWVMSNYGYKIRMQPENDERIFIDEFGDILNVVSGNISFSIWVQSLRRATIYKYYDSKDLKPLLLIIPHMLCLIVYKIAKMIKIKRK